MHDHTHAVHADKHICTQCKQAEHVRECEGGILKWLHSAKSTGGSIRNIWVWGGQGGFCLQAVHWPDTSPRFSLGFYTGGGREVRRNCLGCSRGGKGVYFSAGKISLFQDSYIVFVRKLILFLERNNPLHFHVKMFCCSLFLTNKMNEGFVF